MGLVLAFVWFHGNDSFPNSLSGCRLYELTDQPVPRSYVHPQKPRAIFGCNNDTTQFMPGGTKLK